MFVTVIIPTKNRSRQVLRAVHALLNQTYPADSYEIVVCCDGCDDDSEARLKEIADSRLTVFAIPPSGQVYALNWCIRHAKGTLGIFLDDEMEAEPGLVEAHVYAHASAAGPLALSGHATILAAPSAPPAIRKLAQDCAAHYRAMESPEHIFSPADLNGGHFSAPLEPLAQVGNFNDCYYFERNDFELAVRWMECGHKIGYAKDARADTRTWVTPEGMIKRARARAGTDYRIGSEHPWCMPWLQFHKIFTNARSRRNWRMAWMLAPFAAMILRAAFRAWPQSLRLYNLAYFAEYVCGLRKAAGRWQGLMAMGLRGAR